MPTSCDRNPKGLVSLRKCSDPRFDVMMMTASLRYTLQLGLAPYRHHYEGLATWFVLQGRDYTGEIHDGIEWAALLRLFKGSAWVEAGATTDGKLQAMFMFNF